MLVELALLLVGWLLYYFSVPERFFPKTKWVQLYVTGHILFLIFFMNFAVESQRILVSAIKLNSGYYREREDNWWHVDNIYNKDYDAQRNATLDADEAAANRTGASNQTEYGAPVNQ